MWKKSGKWRRKLVAEKRGIPMGNGYRAVLADPATSVPIEMWSTCLKGLKVLARKMLAASSSATMVLFFDERGVEIDHLARQEPKARAKAAGR